MTFGKIPGADVRARWIGLAAGVALFAGHGTVAARTLPVVDAAATKISLDRWMRDPRSRGTRALGIYQLNGVSAEHYAPGFAAANRFISWSMAKSITSLAAGVLVDAGTLELDAPAPVPAWAGAADPRRTITLRQLLHMSAGLQHEEGARDGLAIEFSDTPRFLFGDVARDAAGYAIAKPADTQPGAVYKYSTATANIVADIVARKITRETDPAKRKQAMAAWLRAHVFLPAGMPSAVPEFDASGNFLGGSLVHATLSDWGQFGLTCLRGGVGPAGGRVVSTQWIDFVRTPAKTDGGYGGHFWLNRPRTSRDGPAHPALFAQKGPADAYAAVGHLGQYVIIVPSKQVVIVRLGKTLDPDLQPVRDWLGDIVNSFPDVPQK